LQENAPPDMGYGLSDGKMRQKREDTRRRTKGRGGRGGGGGSGSLPGRRRDVEKKWNSKKSTRRDGKCSIASAKKNQLSGGPTRSVSHGTTFEEKRKVGGGKRVEVLRPLEKRLGTKGRIINLKRTSSSISRLAGRAALH